MMLKLIFPVVLGAMLIVSSSSDASDQKQGTWILVNILGTKLSPDHFKSYCDLLTVKGDSAWRFTNGQNVFRGTVRDLVLKDNDNCTLSVANDTLRFKSPYVCCDIPYQTDWVRYSDSQLDMKGTWRWVEGEGGIWGTAHTRPDYYEFLKVKSDSAYICVKDSVTSATRIDSFYNSQNMYGSYSWLIVNDTLMAYQVPRCCDFPYLFKWIRWNGIYTSVRVYQHTNISIDAKVKPELVYDFRGRLIKAGKPFSNGIFIKQNNGSNLKVINKVNGK